MSKLNNEGFDFGDIELFGYSDVSNMKLPDPTLLSYYMNLKNREVMWNSEIDDSIIEVSQNIIRWNREDVGIPAESRKPIKIFIHSNGGTLDSTMNVIDLIRLSKTPVMTIGMGKAYSSGGLLLMSGRPGMRYIFPNTTALIHDGSGGTFGTTGKVIDNLEFTKRSEERLRDYIISCTKISMEQYEKNYRKDWFLFPEEIIEYGVADHIITSLDEIM